MAVSFEAYRRVTLFVHGVLRYPFALFGSLRHDISAYQFAFRPKRQCHEIVFILWQLVETNLEWKGSEPPLCVFDGDLPKAYDNVRHSIATEKLVGKKVPKDLVALMPA